MNTRVRTTLQTMKTSLKHGKEKSEMQSSSGIGETQKEKNQNRRSSSRERKLALQQDVDKLKKKLRYEENVHRALERAFTRPLGALPRLPPYLPPYTLELLAEVAVLEEEVIRLEEQLVNFRQGLYQEAVYISTSKKTIEELYDLCPNQSSIVEQPKFSPVVSDLESIMGRSLTSSNDGSNPMPLSSDLVVHQSGQCLNQPTIGKQQPKKLQSCSSFTEDGRGKENKVQINSLKNKLPQQRVARLNPNTKKPSNESRSMEKHQSPHKVRQECPDMVQDRVEKTSPNVPSRTVSDDENNGPNKISEDVLKCLSNIFKRMSRSKASEAEIDMLPSISESSCDFSEEIGFRDPYGICLEFGKRDIGPYKLLQVIDGKLIDPNRVTTSLFLMRRLKLLLGKLASVDLRGLTQQQKLAFWINIYNACMMNAYLEHGIPGSPELVVALMRKAMINVGGHLLNAMTIEHFILRMPYHSKSTHPRCMKNDEVTIRSIFGLDWPEPLVTFALSCGSWSSPAVRVYTALNVENELQEAKRDYLQAAVGISTMKLAIPKLLDWYLLDFAKDLDSLLDWICLQLPCEVRREALKCLERVRSVAIATSIQIIPYEFNFRYLLAP